MIENIRLLSLCEQENVCLVSNCLIEASNLLLSCSFQTSSFNEIGENCSKTSHDEKITTMISVFRHSKYLSRHFIFLILKSPSSQASEARKFALIHRIYLTCFFTFPFFNNFSRRSRSRTP